MTLRNDDKYLDEFLKIARKKIQGGNKEVLLKAMHQCLIMKKPLPDWLRLEFLRAYQSAYPFEINSWDNIFGQPHPKGAHLEARRRHFKLSLPIFTLVQKLGASGEIIDKRTQTHYDILKPHRKNSKKR
jgi:hypothetical protein